MSGPSLDGGDLPPDPAALLPADSVLTFEEYMAMQRAVGEETRYRVLYALKHRGEMSPTELRSVVDDAGSSLHHHLNRLVAVGLVEKRAHSEADSRGLFTYYRATAFGEAILDHGVEELLRKEGEYLDMYAVDDDETENGE